MSLTDFSNSLRDAVTDSALRELSARIRSRDASVAIVGQGYVGLTLASTAAIAGFRVLGIDVDLERTASLGRGEPAVPGVDRGLFEAGIETSRLDFSVDPSGIKDADVVCICVPTPVRDHAPDLSYVVAAGTTVADALRTGQLVILESTTYPGTTDGLLQGILEGDGLRAGTDFLLAYSPERVDPANDRFSMQNTPRVVGGTSILATETAVTFYEQMVEHVVAVSSTRAAETSKLLENTFRHVNIALVNELATLCHEIDIDIWEVIDAAASKPFGFMPFYPGPGVGGHCIPLDPTYLAWQIRRESGRRFGMLDQAQDVNERMPEYVAARVGGILNDQGRSVRGARVLVLGVAYKPDVGDMRESPALQTMLLLHKRGADVRFHDFFVNEVALNGGTARCVADLDAELSAADVVVLLTPHSDYRLETLAERSRLIFDTRNAFGADRPANVLPL